NNEEDWNAFQPWAHAASEPTSTVGVRATGVSYTESQGWNDEVRDYLRINRDTLAERVAGWDGVTLSPIEGTYIGLIDFTELAQRGTFNGATPAAYLRENAKVSLTEGSLCGADYSNFGRMIFATPLPVLTEALDRIENALYGA
ncbi:MAG: MalY/PatB family protein, partial [Ancrocorticia sp.]